MSAVLVAALSAHVEATEARLKDVEMKLAGVIASGQLCQPAGGGAPEPIGLIDFESTAASWGGVSKSISDLAGTVGPWVLDPSHVHDGGVNGESFFGLLNEALAAVLDPDGVVMVLDCTVSGGGNVQMELHNAPGFDTDGIYFRGEVNSGVSDGNGGGSANTATGEAGRAKVAFLVSSAVQSASDNGGAIVTCDPPVARTTEPNRAAFAVPADGILHSIAFYAASTDLTVVAAP